MHERMATPLQRKSSEVGYALETLLWESPLNQTAKPFVVARLHRKILRHAQRHPPGERVATCPRDEDAQRMAVETRVAYWHHRSAAKACYALAKALRAVLAGCLLQTAPRKIQKGGSLARPWPPAHRRWAASPAPRNLGS